MVLAILWNARAYAVRALVARAGMVERTQLPLQLLFFGKLGHICSGIGQTLPFASYNCIRLSLMARAQQTVVSSPAAAGESRCVCKRASRPHKSLLTVAAAKVIRTPEDCVLSAEHMPLCSRAGPSLRFSHLFACSRTVRHTPETSLR